MKENYMFRSGITMRWLNNAGFEIILPGGKHLFVDPWLDEADIYPFPIDQIERMDYVLLTHTHFDHADSIGKIQQKFPKAAIFVGDLSADALCMEYHLNVERLFRVRHGEVYQFDDVKIEAIGARHTESRNGNYYDKGYCIRKDGSRSPANWFGSMEMLNYRITAADGSRFVVWGGMTTEEQIYRMKEYQGNDIAVMHVSPKQDFTMFSRLVDAIQPKVVIPHHYDIWDTLFEKNPAMKQDAPLPPEQVNADNILKMIKEQLENNCKNVEFFIPEHHRWYRFGLAVNAL
jgi:L-ascorbate metabolism protein UlaG (beta-lactamase superfamily)